MHRTALLNPPLPWWVVWPGTSIEEDKKYWSRSWSARCTSFHLSSLRDLVSASPHCLGSCKIPFKNFSASWQSQCLRWVSVLHQGGSAKHLSFTSYAKDRQISKGKHGFQNWLLKSKFPHYITKVFKVWKILSFSKIVLAQIISSTNYDFMAKGHSPPKTEKRKEVVEEVGLRGVTVKKCFILVWRQERGSMSPSQPIKEVCKNLLQNICWIHGFEGSCETKEEVRRERKKSSWQGNEQGLHGAFRIMLKQDLSGHFRPPQEPGMGTSPILYTGNMECRGRVSLFHKWGCKFNSNSHEEIKVLKKITVMNN